MNKEVDSEKKKLGSVATTAKTSVNTWRAIILCRHDQRKGSNGKSAVSRENRTAALRRC